MTTITLTIYQPQETTLYRNVIVFGDPQCAAVVSKLVVDSIAGSPAPVIGTDSPATDTDTDPPASVTSTDRDKTVFNTRKHLVTSSGSNHRYIFYETIGLPESNPTKIVPALALSNLHRFASVLAGGINLLIYAVSDKPSKKNYELFNEYVCDADAPIILIRTDPALPSNFKRDEVQYERDGYRFKQVLILRGTDMATLRRDITKSLNLSPKVILPMDRFEQTAMKSWNLLEKEAGWKLKECRDALKKTLMEDGLFSEESANTKYKEVADYIQK